MKIRRELIPCLLFATKPVKKAIFTQTNTQKKVEPVSALLCGCQQNNLEQNNISRTDGDMRWWSQEGSLACHKVDHQVRLIINQQDRYKKARNKQNQHCKQIQKLQTANKVVACNKTIKMNGYYTWAVTWNTNKEPALLFTILVRKWLWQCPGVATVF